MNSLMLLNGSPRGERSNSMKMLKRVAEGWEYAGGKMPETLHLARRVDFTRAVEAFAHADFVLLGMPLYTDSMPALVKKFIEAIGPLVATTQAEDKNPTLGFLIQSGFSEALHARPLERYLEKLTRRLGCTYAGTIVRGGGEALQMMPDRANEKLWIMLRTLGGQLARDSRFGEADLKKISGVERFSPLAASIAGALFKVPLMQFYWNRPLKKNGVWERRFAAPYGPAFKS